MTSGPAQSQTARQELRNAVRDDEVFALLMANDVIFELLEGVQLLLKGSGRAQDL
jgi:hypothetical protein